MRTCTHISLRTHMSHVCSTSSHAPAYATQSAKTHTCTPRGQNAGDHAHAPGDALPMLTANHVLRSALLGVCEGALGLSRPCSRWRLSSPARVQRKAYINHALRSVLHTYRHCTGAHHSQQCCRSCTLPPASPCTYVHLKQHSTHTCISSYMRTPSATPHSSACPAKCCRLGSAIMIL